MNKAIVKEDLKKKVASVKHETRQDVDVVGPPDKVSNLRPVVFAIRQNESNLEKGYRETREATQHWNQQFWSKHNRNFAAEYNQFRNTLKQKEAGSSMADQMSVFYKRFLDNNWKTHVRYNLEWYRRNVVLLLLEVKVKLSRLKFK